MSMTTRVITFDLLDITGQQQNGSVAFKMNVPNLIDTIDETIYVQDSNTYSLSVGQSEPLITTDNASTEPPAGQWSYLVSVSLSPGTTNISVTNALLPAGEGTYSLAAMIAAAQSAD